MNCAFKNNDYLCKDLALLTSEYLVNSEYKLKDWIDLEKINWSYLSLNSAAIDLLKTHPEKIYWTYLSLNPAAIDLIRAHPEKTCWTWLSKNPAIFELNKKKYKSSLNNTAVLFT